MVRANKLGFRKLNSFLVEKDASVRDVQFTLPFCLDHSVVGRRTSSMLAGRTAKMQGHAFRSDAWQIGSQFSTCRASAGIGATDVETGPNRSSPDLAEKRS